MNNNDELQVLGKSRKLIKREKWLIAFMGPAMLSAVVLLGVWGHRRFAKDEIVEQRETTIVPELQQAVDSLLNEELELIGGLQGQVIVMEVQTGEILAMVGRERRFDGKFQPCRNFGYQQEPGSTMMTAVLLALLETGEVEQINTVVPESCPHCAERQMSKFGQTKNGVKRYIRKGCGKTFTTCK